MQELANPAGAYKAVKSRGGELKFLNPTKKVHGILVITGLDKVFEVYTDEQRLSKLFQNSPRVRRDTSSSDFSACDAPLPSSELTCSAALRLFLSLKAGKAPTDFHTQLLISRLTGYVRSSTHTL